MKLTKVIESLWEILKEHGDIECFSSHIMADAEPRFQTKKEACLPKHFNMPKKFVVLGDTND